MKRYGYIYEKICNKENIRRAILRASKGKRYRKDVQKILADMAKYIKQIQDMLINETYVPSDYRIDTIREGIEKKERIIYKPNFYPDQVVQWAIMLELSPILSDSMYEFTCGSIPNRGVHYGKRYVEKWIKTDRKNTKYYLKLDISKFYPSVDIEILKNKIERKIKDKKLLNLIYAILDKEEKGLPIGILVSQWFANFYLQDLDYYIKQNLKAVHYIRYMDDMIIFGRNKKELHKIRKTITEFLIIEKLSLKSNWQLYKLDKEALDFMGFRFFRNKTILRKSIMLRITRKVKKVSKKHKLNFHDSCGVVSYLGWIKHSDSFWLFQKWIQPYLRIQILKEIIKNHMKERSKNEKLQKPKHRNTKRAGYRIKHHHSVPQYQRGDVAAKGRRTTVL